MLLTEKKKSQTPLLICKYTVPGTAIVANAERLVTYSDVLRKNKRMSGYAHDGIYKMSPLIS